MSLGTGRPIVLRDENTIRHCRVLLSHPMASPTDVRLISLVELIAHKSEYFSAANLILDSPTFDSTNLRFPCAAEWSGEQQRSIPDSACK